MAIGNLKIVDITKQDAATMCIAYHYLHRKPPISFAYALAKVPSGCREGVIVGIITFGVPASRHLQKSLCKSNPDLVLELNRLWVHDALKKNSESWFISHALKMLPPRIICSYADTEVGHVGYVYRASNWNYYGYTDMDRKTPRFDYVVKGKHSRDAFRGGNEYTKVRRKPKYRYWTVTGTKRDKRRLTSLCGWKSLNWNEVTITKKAPN